MAAITITNATATATYELPDEVGTELTIGSAEDCSIPLPGVRGLSACHCRITRMAEGFVLSDANSLNGTYADARRIASEYLATGITYTVGEATFTYSEDESEAKTRPIPLDSEEPEEAKTKPLPATQEPSGEVKKKKVVRRKAAAHPAGLSAAELQQAAQKYRRDMARKRMTLIYIVVILAAAFYAGLALYSWQSTGNPLPVFLR